MTTDPALQPPLHIPTFPFTPYFFSLLVCQCLAPGWLGVWLQLFLLKLFFMTAMMYPHCGMYWSCACNLSSSAVRFSVLDSQSLYCTLWKGRENSATLLGWLTRLNQQSSLFHFLSPSLGHMSVCVVLSHIVECFHKTAGSWFLRVTFAVNL